MQKLEIELLEKIKKMKPKKADKRFEGLEEGMNLCPECHYIGKYSPKGSLKVFENGDIKCFNCDLWRKKR